MKFPRHEIPHSTEQPSASECQSTLCRQNCCKAGLEPAAPAPFLVLSHCVAPEGSTQVPILLSAPFLRAAPAAPHPLPRTASLPHPHVHIKAAPASS